MSIDWYNGFVTSLDLLSEPRFLLLIILNCIVGTLLAQMIINVNHYHKIKKSYPTQTLIPIFIIFGYGFLFAEAIQYYYLRPIAFYLLFLFILSSLIRLSIPHFLAKRSIQKKASSKRRR